MEWTPLHFKVNKSYWKHFGNDAALPFRVRNLIDLQAILAGHGIVSWLFGRTLLDVVTRSQLLDDHDDDLIACFDPTQPLDNKVGAAIEQAGFTIIRKTPDMISLMRDDRYIDLHGHHAVVPEVAEAYAHGVHFTIRADSTKVLTEKYGADFAQHRAHAKSVGYLLRYGSSRLRSEWKRDPVGTRKKIRRHLPELAGKALGSLTRKLKPGGRKVVLSEAEFLALKIDADDAINWSWRGPHLTALIHKGETFGQAKTRLMASGLLTNFKDSIDEVNTLKAFPGPMYLSRRFWQEGNNLFVYPAAYGFRHLVLPYHAANLYICAEIMPKLYSAEYFEALPPMSDTEIKTFLADNPLEITDGALSSGRHRASAMLGRLARGEDYIPLIARVVR